MDLNSFAAAVQASPIATAIREGDNLFPWIESLHVLAIVTVVGTISIVDLRLLGVPAHRLGVRRLTAQLLPFTWAAFAVAAVTGSLLFSSNATKYVVDLPFRIKMVLLLVAGANMIFFHFLTFRSVHLWDEAEKTPPAAKIAGGASLCLWIAIIACGRLIGFTVN